MPVSVVCCVGAGTPSTLSPSRTCVPTLEVSARHCHRHCHCQCRHMLTHSTDIPPAHPTDGHQPLPITTPNANLFPRRLWVRREVVRASVRDHVGRVGLAGIIHDELSAVHVAFREQRLGHLVTPSGSEFNGRQSLVGLRAAHRVKARGRYLATGQGSRCERIQSRCARG